MSWIADAGITFQRLVEDNCFSSFQFAEEARGLLETAKAVAFITALRFTPLKRGVNEIQFAEEAREPLETAKAVTFITALRFTPLKRGVNESFC